MLLFDRSSMYGLKVVVSQCLLGHWQFPCNRFVEYEPKDEWWCRKYGFGREVFDAVRIGDMLIVHPSTMEELEKTFHKEQRREGVSASH